MGHTAVEGHFRYSIKSQVYKYRFQALYEYKLSSIRCQYQVSKVEYLVSKDKSQVTSILYKE